MQANLVSLKKYLALRIELPLNVLPVSFGALILRSCGEIFFNYLVIIA